MNEKDCLLHGDDDCKECPYYDLTIEVESGRFETRFWAGQRCSVGIGYYGDFVALEPRQFKYE